MSNAGVCVHSYLVGHISLSLQQLSEGSLRHRCKSPVRMGLYVVVGTHLGHEIWDPGKAWCSSLHHTHPFIGICILMLHDSPLPVYGPPVTTAGNPIISALGLPEGLTVCRV